MAAQALYRRWRPQSFEDVIGQTPITRTLANAIAGEHMAHAYLFTGPRGTGKTSVARIVAKAVNCVGDGAARPCNSCHICTAITEGRLIDLIEIDAASNTGVDDVRDLREKVAFAPNEARLKVYIIDEVHMLSTAAFNALLKTLEEPPPHVLFILATTEPHKIPDTIVSRCQRHDFRRVSVADVTGKLQRICDAEGAEAEAEALELIARSATGSIRDAESLLDLLIASTGTITQAAVREALGTAGDEAVVGIVDAIVDSDAAAGLRWIHQSIEAGADPTQLRLQVLEHLRGILLVQTGVADELLHASADTVAVMRRQAAGVSPRRLAGALRRLVQAPPVTDRGHRGLLLELAVAELALAEEPTAKAPSPPAAGAATAAAAEKTPRRRPSSRAKGSGKGQGAADQGGKSTAMPAPKAADDQGAKSAAVPAPKAAGDQGAKSTAVPAPKAAGGKGVPFSQGAPAKSGPKSATGTPPRTGGDVSAPPASADVSQPPATTDASPSRGGDSLETLVASWPELLATVDRQDRNLGALLKDCRPEQASVERVTLGFFFDFHCRRASEPKRSALLRQALHDVTGIDREVVCTVVQATPVETRARPKTKADQAATDPVVRHAVDELGARIASVGDPEDEKAS